jgi:hypothetical protein
MKVSVPVGMVVMFVGLIAMADSHNSIGAFIVGFSIFLFDKQLIEFEYIKKAK